MIERSYPVSNFVVYGRTRGSPKGPNQDMTKFRLLFIKCFIVSTNFRIHRKYFKFKVGDSLSLINSLFCSLL